MEKTVVWGYKIHLEIKKKLFNDRYKQHWPAGKITTPKLNRPAYQIL